MKPIDTIRDYIERSTHWREGGADRHEALKVALPALEADMAAQFPCRETIRAVLALFSFEGCDFNYNEPNDYGSIRGTIFTGRGDANDFRGEELTSTYVGNVVKGNGHYRINELGVRRIEALIKEKQK